MSVALIVLMVLDEEPLFPSGALAGPGLVGAGAGGAIGTRPLQQLCLASSHTGGSTAPGLKEKRMGV